MGQIVGDKPCPQCRGSGGDKTGNHLILFEDGGAYCNRCNYTELPNGQAKEEEMTYANTTMEEIAGFPAFAMPHKQISVEAAEHYGVRCEFNAEGTPSKYWYPHRSAGQIDGWKGKSLDKHWSVVGNTKRGELFGASVVKPGGKFIVITEGEDDALAVWDTLRDRSNLTGWVPPVVSLIHGAAGASKDIAENLEYLLTFDRIVLCFDEDDAGRTARDNVCSLVPDKIYITKLGLKDANDMVLAGRAEELKWDVLKHAQRYQPDGIVNGADTWDRYNKAVTATCTPYPKEWAKLNEMTYGFRTGEIITITSGTGVGKTAIMRELKLHVWRATDWNIADISLEEDVGDSVAGIMSLAMGKRLHLPDVQVSQDDAFKVHTDIFASRRFNFYDHFGGMDDNNLFNKLRYFAATGHRAIFLDHLSIIVSEYAAEGGERERIDTVMTKLAKIAKELDVAIFIVVHLRKEGFGRSFEQGAVPSLDDLRGSGTLKQLSWDVIALSRDQQHADPYCRDTSKLTVLKCRFSGRTGTADYLHFDPDTGLMSVVPEPMGYEPQDKLS